MEEMKTYVIKELQRNGWAMEELMATYRRMFDDHTTLKRENYQLYSCIESAMDDYSTENDIDFDMDVEDVFNSVLDEENEFED